MKRLLFLALFALPLLAQQPDSNALRTGSYFSVFREVALSATNDAVTLQIPARAGRFVHLQAATFQCSVACTVTMERNGTAATATALTPVSLNNNSVPTATAYGASDAGVGSVITKLDVSAGTPTSVALSYTALNSGQSTAQNFTFRTNSITGTFRVTLLWTER